MGKAAGKIIEKYADQRLDNHVFYMPCNCHCNDILREIGKQCGIKNKLTFHLTYVKINVTIIESWYLYANQRPIYFP